MSVTYGTLILDGSRWKLRCEPHVLLTAKRLFRKIAGGAQGEIDLPATPEMSRDLEWFSFRYPLEISHPEELTSMANRHRESIARLAEIIGPDYTPRKYDLALPARDYQRLAADWILRTGQGLLADDVGLGKTVSAITAIASGEPLPACVVCLAHLPQQWKREIERFAPDLHVHVCRTTEPYLLPRRKGRGPDVLICTYTKLAGWAEVVAGYCESVIFDEAQELRRSSDGRGGLTKKYAAAKHAAENVELRLGLSATPVYNYGGEIFNLFDVLAPGKLGDPIEFYREWCEGQFDKPRLKDPAAFGSWLRSEFLMLRRTRKDVGRELEPLTRITHMIDSDTKALEGVTSKASELARIILSEGESHRGAKRAASQEFDNVLRQATGIAKAPFVAAFVDLLIENGERVVLFGWHRAVYEIWMERLAHHSPAMYTGSETAAAKDHAVDRFTSGLTPLLIVSLRSGAGLDGLQRACRTVVFGELDWSPQVHDQCIGRVARDGQTDPVTSYFLLSEEGLDPIMAEVLGLKAHQSIGILDLGQRDLEQRADSSAALRRLAETYARRAG